MEPRETAFRGIGLDVFDLRDRLVDDYEEFTRSFITLRDEHVRAKVDDRSSTRACSGPSP